MLQYLLNNKWLTATIICGFAIFLGLVGHWAKRNAADPRENLLQGEYASAFEKYERSAKTGDPAAQNTLGNIYYLGLGVKPDFEEAAQWYLRAAKRGEGYALLNLGILHRHGLGIEKDVVKAFACFRLAKQAGIKNAEDHMNFLTRMNQITAHMVQAAMKNYKDLPSLTKNIKIGVAPQQPQ